MDWRDELWPEWQIVSEIGSGAYGTVYKIERHDIGGKYYAALKVITYPTSDEDIDNLRAANMTDEQISAYYTGIAHEISKEFAVMERLKGNTNIVSYEDHKIISYNGGMRWVVMIRMELLTTLSDYLKLNEIDAKDVCRLGIDICNALILCEKEQIIHRDIKPGNIFVSPHGDFKLGDFSLARNMDLHAKDSTPQGTYGYMAPEVYKKEDYDNTIDIYALGLIMYKLLNRGRSPFQPLPPAPLNHDIIEQANRRRLRETELPGPVDASPIMNAIIQNCCAYYPENRYKSASVVQSVLSNYLDKYDEKNKAVQEDDSSDPMGRYFTMAGDL